MTARRTRRDAVDRTTQGIDRMVRNVETGRFERSLSALTAAGALVTAAEIYFEHDSASFGNKMMWVPVVLGPVGAAAGVAGFFSRRMAKTALPVASAAIVANGLQGAVPACSRHRAEAGRLVQRPLQHGDGTAAARAAAGHHGGRHGPARSDLAAGEVSGRPGRPATAAGSPGSTCWTRRGTGTRSRRASSVPDRSAAGGRGSSPPPEEATARALLDQLTGQDGERLAYRPGDDRRAAGRGRDRRLAICGHAGGRAGLAELAGLPG